MKASEIRKKFVEYFESKDHMKNSSSSLVPHNDPTIMFANAGMNQFKDYFTGKATAQKKRAVTIQKCVRAGGKHNDLENVGFTARHHTFFEMLGNFSFGDYFKEDAIAFAWEFLTVTLGIDKSKLYVSVHHSDQEAAKIWEEQQGVPKDRIFFRDDKENFWEMGDVGPCGPSSEIFYDHGEKYSDPNADTSECLLDDEQRYVEIWNLVFMQYEKFKEGDQVKRQDLPNPSIDTGAGLERLAAVMEGKYNNYDTDVFKLIMDAIEKETHKKYADYLSSFRVVADHIRSATMLITDGVIPANDGRGYVLRRIIRRAIRHFEEMGVHEVTLYKLVPVVFESLSGEYPENESNRSLAEKYLKLEEESFRKTLANGLELLKKQMETLKKSGQSTLGGEVVFKLYDTYGFPVDLTQTILEESGLSLNQKEFDSSMERQKERSRKAGSFDVKGDNLKEFYSIKEKYGETEFLGYKNLEAQGSLIHSLELDGNTYLVFDKTPFYGESGGQAGDQGEVLDDNGVVLAVVADTQKPVDGLHVHIVKGAVNLEKKTYHLRVNKKQRQLSARNHTATHLLQAALINVLGDHVKQAGSYVGPNRLRFDFTHPESMSKAQWKKVEELVNAEVRKDTELTAELMTKEEATSKGAMALFGEKYGDTVRVVTVPDFSVELCGGTHVASTGEISYFTIVSESSLQAGVRRIEAATSDSAFEFVNQRLQVLESIEGSLKAKGEQLIKKADQLLVDNQSKQKEIKALKDKLQSQNSQELFDGVEKIKEDLVYKSVAAPEGSDLRKLGDLFIDKNPKGVLLVHMTNGDKASVLLKTFKKNAVVNCGEILKTVLSEFGGRGGGKPDMAQGSLDAKHVDQLATMVREKLTQ